MKKLLGAATALSLLAGSAWAQGFYDGKTVTYIIATEPGGGYDTYGRLVGKYMEKHLGAARMVFRNLPGAGHIVGTNTLAASPPDGLTIGTFNTGLIYAQLLGTEGIRFDLTELSWVGKAASDPRVMVTSTGSGLETFEDLRAAEGRILFAAAGVGSASYQETKLLGSALGLPIEIVAGFNGNEGELAMMRGEVVGHVASLSSISPFSAAGNGQVVASIGGDGTPQAIDLAVDEDGAGIINLIAATSLIGRLTAAPPGVPEDVLAELRTAYMAAMNDPEFLAEAQALGIPVDPADGETVEQLVVAGLSQTPETVAMVRAALTEEASTVTVTTALAVVGNDGREVTISVDGADVVLEPSGSRTAITVNGAEAKRDALVAGMTCEIEYDPAAEGNEPKSMACTN
jgi:tripartite-type tricarboxylate transporter receptor subunit TctC